MTNAATELAARTKQNETDIEVLTAKWLNSMSALSEAIDDRVASLLVAGDMRIATTAALGAGTKTLDTYSAAAIAAPGPITASLNGQIIPSGTTLWQSEIGDGEYPLVLAQNEGLSIRSVAVPATGTWTMAVDIQWAEVAAY